LEIDIGRGKKGRRAYGFDDIAIVPSRRTRDPDDIDISWTLGPYRFELPLVAAAMDGVVNPDTAALVNRLGGLGVLNLEGIWTRFENAEEQLEKIAAAPRHLATRTMQEIYAEPVKPELIGQRIVEIKERGAVACGSLTPQRVREQYEIAVEAGIDILVIQGTVISAEHVSTTVEPLNLKEFIAEVPVPTVVGGCASCGPARWAFSSESGPAPPARPAACSGSASRRRPRSPTWPRPAPSTCWRPATTST
jgi:IMP dehydrogenase